MVSRHNGITLEILCHLRGRIGQCVWDHPARDLRALRIEVTHEEMRSSEIIIVIKTYRARCAVSSLRVLRRA